MRLCSCESCPRYLEFSEPPLPHVEGYCGLGGLTHCLVNRPIVNQPIEQRVQKCSVSECTESFHVVCVYMMKCVEDSMNDRTTADPQSNIFYCETHRDKYGTKETFAAPPGVDASRKAKSDRRLLPVQRSFAAVQSAPSVPTKTNDGAHSEGTLTHKFMHD